MSESHHEYMMRTSQSYRKFIEGRNRELSDSIPVLEPGLRAEEESRKTVIVDTFQNICFRELTLKAPLIVVYANPSDFPDKFVARLWDLNRPTKLAVFTNTIAEIREAIPDQFVRLDPSPDDDPVITEIWI